MSKEAIRWPNGARCAVMISFDMDGETTWANGNRGIKGGDKFIRSLSVGQYGPTRGVPRILDLLKEYNVPATFFVPSWCAEHYPDVFKRIARENHDIGNHGYTHERFFEKTVEEQTEIIEKSQRIFENLIGKKAVGFRTPSGDWSKATPGLLNKMGFLYSSSMRGDDRPYRTVIDGKTTDLIEIPTRWELDDYVQFAYHFYPAEPVGQPRISTHEHVLDNFIQEFDGYYHYGLCCSFMLHPQVIGKPGRVLLLEKLIQHIKSYPDVWFATGEQIATWWRKNY